MQGFDIVHVHGVDFFCHYLAALRVFNRKLLALSTHGGFFHTGYAKTLEQVDFISPPVSRSNPTAGCLRRASMISPSSNRLPGAVSCSSRMASIRAIPRRRSRDFPPVLSVPWPFCLQQTPGSADRGIPGTGRARPAERALYCRPRLGRHAAEDGGCDPRRRARGSGPDSDRSAEDEIREVMHRCSFFITASESEGFGISLVEAMSAGLIPIAGGIPSFKAILAKVVGASSVTLQTQKQPRPASPAL